MQAFQLLMLEQVYGSIASQRLIIDRISAQVSPEVDSQKFLHPESLHVQVQQNLHRFLPVFPQSMLAPPVGLSSAIAAQPG
ncbi:hypothetical protein NIES2104_54790 [Leptolyngbya sp. NIES-2104]|nr:hypothetical protein NIES2104_54790 [Leptolyngbya sp. NIES-2104]